MLCLFVSDLHGRVYRYEKLFESIIEQRPKAVFLGGDLTPSGLMHSRAHGREFQHFITDYLILNFQRLKRTMGLEYPEVFIILGNDDARIEESAITKGESQFIWKYAHLRKFEWEGYDVYGYAYVPPSPFLLKDWERYDVSRYVDPGCVSPEEGARSVPISADEQKYSTIKKDLESLVETTDLSKSIFLFHSPPYNTKLDRAGLDGKFVDDVPLDPHVGSIAIRQLIETRQPLITLHGHIHETARLSGSWRDSIGRTQMFSAAHDGPELALVRFDPENPSAAIRVLL
jgi:Icc-related predicted phosphoesterase